jgi:uncharacterized repeat protein (TIGR04138 family)
MQKLNFAEAVEEIIAHDNRYDREAYQFVRESLDYTLKKLKRKGREELRHVSGQELLEGIRKNALEQFGPLSRTVLEYWGVRRCEDFGEIVFNLVEKGVLGKSEQDSRADFQGGYDFDEAFVKPFLASSRAQLKPRNVRPPSNPDAGHIPNSGRAANENKLSGGTN